MERRRAVRGRLVHVCAGRKRRPHRRRVPVPHRGRQRRAADGAGGRTRRRGERREEAGGRDQAGSGRTRASRSRRQRHGVLLVGCAYPTANAPVPDPHTRLYSSRTIPRFATAVRRRNRGGSWGSGRAESWISTRRRPVGKTVATPRIGGGPSRAVSVGRPGYSSKTIPRSATAVRRRNRGGSWGSGRAESWISRGADRSARRWRPLESGAGRHAPSAWDAPDTRLGRGGRNALQWWA